MSDIAIRVEHLSKLYRLGVINTPVDVLANYKTNFDQRSKLPAIERVISQKGIVLYESN